MPVRAKCPRVSFAPRVFMVVHTAPLMARLLSVSGTRYRNTTSRYHSIENQNPLARAWRTPSNEGIGRSYENLSLLRPRCLTLIRHHQPLTRKTRWLCGQALDSLLAATQTVIANHYTSGVAYGVYDRNSGRSLDSARLHSWHNRPEMNDLGTWAEL